MSDLQTKEEFSEMFNEMVDFCKEFDILNENYTNKKSCDELYDLYINKDDLFAFYTINTFIPNGDNENFLFLRIKKHNIDFTLLRGYNKRVINCMLQLCISNYYGNTTLENINNFFKLLTCLDDIYDIIFIVVKNKNNINDKEKEEDEKEEEITDYDLRMLLYDSLVEKSKKCNTEKMTNLFDMVISKQEDIGTDFFMYFTFEEDRECYNVHSFALIDRYFEDAIRNHDSNMVEFEIDEGVEYDEEICTEMIRYLYTGDISNETSLSTIKVLYTISKEFNFLLKDICESLLNQEDDLRF